MGASRNTGFGFAAAAGLCGCLAGLSGKLALDSRAAALLFSLVPETILSPAFLEYSRVAMRVGMFALLFVLNALMFNFFAKSLCHSSAVTATITSTSVNFLATGLLGTLLLGEATPPLWWGGACSLLIGLLCINASTTPDSPETQSAAGVAAGRGGSSGGGHNKTKKKTS